MLSTSARSAPLVWFGLQKIPHLSGLSSQPRHWTPVLFPRGVVHESTSLRPFAPGPLRPFFATTNALTPARLYSVQVSLLHITWPSRPSVSNHPSILRDRFTRYPSTPRTSRFHGSGLHLSLAGSSVAQAESSFLTYG